MMHTGVQLPLKPADNWYICTEHEQPVQICGLPENAATRQGLQDAW